MLETQNPLFWKIDSIKGFIDNILDEYPRLFYESNQRLEEHFRKLARIESKGDAKQEELIYINHLSAFENDGYILNEFYKAMFLVGYSYYEGTMQLINSELTPYRIQKEIERIDVVSSESIIDDARYLYDKIRPIRNGLSHNSAGTILKGQADAMVCVAKSFSDVEYDAIRKTFFFHGPSLIKDTISRSHRVLYTCAKLYGNQEILKL